MLNESKKFLNLFSTNRLQMEVRIEQSWKEVLQDEFDKSYFKDLAAALHAEKDAGRKIYPPGSKIFNAFNLTPFDKVKVVILGQDPYHNPGQAEGLSFSVPEGIQPPPSLLNIYKEIEDDLGVRIDKSNGSLKGWAEQGVFLLNAILTVRAGQAASHSGLGWQTFTDGRHSIPAVGQFRKKQETPYRHQPPLCAGSRTPFSPCKRSFLRMQTFFKNQSNTN